MNDVRILEKIRFRKVLSEWARRACWVIGGAMVCWLLVLWFYIPWLRKIEIPIREKQSQLVEIGGFTWKINPDNSTEIARFECLDQNNPDNWTVRWEEVIDNRIALIKK